MSEFNEEATSYLQVLRSLASDNADNKALLDFALANEFESGVVPAADGSLHSAAAYAIQLMSNALAVADANGEQTMGAESRFYRISVLLALERARAAKDSGLWGFGSKLIFDLRRNGIVLPRNEIAALLAQENGDNNLLADNPLAQDVYAGDIATRCGSLSSAYVLSAHKPTGNLAPDVQAVWDTLSAAPDAMSTQQVLETLLLGVIQRFLGANVAMFGSWLRKSGFYTAPMGTSGPYARESGLADWTRSVMRHLLSLTNPTTPEDAGKYAFLALCQGLCHCQRYRKIFYETKQVVDSSADETANGMTVVSVPAEGYIVEDLMPFGDGRKSLYIAASYFPNAKALTDDVAAAIACYDPSQRGTERYLQRLTVSPLAMLLHIATFQAEQEKAEM